MVKTREVFLEAGKITIEERELPKLGANEVLIETHMASVCGSERYFYRGIIVPPEHKARGRYIPPKYRKPASSLRCPLGHEGGGTIIEVGSAVGEYLYHPGRRIQVGDRVSFYTPTYTDYTLTEAVSTSGLSVQPIPEEFSFEAGCLFEPFGCAGYAALHMGVKPGDIVSINGCGFSGLVLMQGALKHGASEIVALDIVERKLEVARRLASRFKARFHAINPYKEDYVARVNEITDDEGVDVATENIGGTGTGIRQALDQVKHNGILALYGDNYAPFPNFPFHRFHEDGLEIRTLNAVHYNELQNVMNVNEAYRAAARGAFDEFWPILWENSDRHKLGEIAEVFAKESENLEKQSSIKTIFTP